VLGGHGVAFEPGIASADLVLTLAYDLAVSIASGTASAQRAFLDGDIRLGGDVTVLLGTVDALATIDDRLSDLRSVTSYR
jgi:lipid-binding SYLF domain-containing protein